MSCTKLILTHEWQKILNLINKTYLVQANFWHKHSISSFVNAWKHVDVCLLSFLPIFSTYITQHSQCLNYYFSAYFFIRIFLTSVHYIFLSLIFPEDNCASTKKVYKALMKTNKNYSLERWIKNWRTTK